MNSRLKLTAVALLVSAAVGYLAFVGAACSWQYYVSVDEAVIDSVNLTGKRIRVSGRVAAESLTISEGRRVAEFDIAGAQHRLHVSCRCAMPDNLAENIDVVVEGVFQDHEILGHKIITRCASKYERKESLATRNAMPSSSSYR